jgi:hypothetical protein
MNRTDTFLTTPQHLRLDDIGGIDEDRPGKDPLAKVVGWYVNGPVVRGGQGRLVRVLPNGRLNPLGSKQREEMGG